VYQDPSAEANCQWYQDLVVQELNGFGVTLNRFLANGIDLSSQIYAYFGSTRLTGLGSLQGGVCWTGITPPEALTFELDGTDVKGNTVSSSTSATFEGPPATFSALSLSDSSEAFQIGSSRQRTSTTLDLDVPAGVPWSVSVFPSNRTTSWLTVVPDAGTGPARVTITASGAGAGLGPPNEVVEATLAFQAPEAVPAFIIVPVTLSLGWLPYRQ
jgi:hypothetical protein